MEKSKVLQNRDSNIHEIQIQKLTLKEAWKAKLQKIKIRTDSLIQNTIINSTRASHPYLLKTNKNDICLGLSSIDYHQKQSNTLNLSTSSQNRNALFTRGNSSEIFDRFDDTQSMDYLEVVMSKNHSNYTPNKKNIVLDL